MKFTAILSTALLPLVNAATIYLAGDSTMARGNPTDGWGNHLQQYTTLTVSNHALGGRSARSFTREGRFQTIINSVRQGDWVVIEFGHNDGGSLNQGDNGRSACGGSGEEVCRVVYNGQQENVLTYFAYLRNAARDLKNRGANVIISSPTTNNLWKDVNSWPGYTPNRFTDMARKAAQATGSYFIDHGSYMALRYQQLGKWTVDSFYPVDHKHTSPAGANVVAQIFMAGVNCQIPDLKRHNTNAGNNVPYIACQRGA